MYSTLPRTKPFLMTQLYQPAEDIVYVHWQMITHFAAEMSGMVYTTDVASPVDVLSIPLGLLPENFKHSIRRSDGRTSDGRTSGDRTSDGRTTERGGGQRGQLTPDLNLAGAPI